MDHVLRRAVRARLRVDADHGAVVLEDDRGVGRYRLFLADAGALVGQEVEGAVLQVPPAHAHAGIRGTHVDQWLHVARVELVQLDRGAAGRRLGRVVGCPPSTRCRPRR